MWAMKAADWHYENDRNVGIVALATNRVFFAGKGPVCGGWSWKDCIVGRESRRCIILNCTDNYDVAEIKVKSVTDHQ